MDEKNEVSAGMGGGGGKSSSGIEENSFLDYTIIGSVFAQRGSRKIKLISLESFTGKEEKIILEDGDKIITEKGCAISLSGGDSLGKEYISLTLFPDSEAVLSIKSSKNEGAGKSITQSISKIELIRGLFIFSVTTQGKIEDKIVIPSKYPAFEFKPLFGEYSKSKQAAAIIELNNDGSIVFFNTMNRVMHRNAKLIAGGMHSPGNSKIVLTNSAIYCTDNIKNPDERVNEIRNRISMLPQYAACFAGKKFLFEMQKTKEKKRTNQKEEILKGLQGQLKGLQELGDESLINQAKEQIESTKEFFSKTPLDEENEEEIIKKRKQLAEKMIKQGEESVRKFFLPIPSYSALREEDKITAKTIVNRTGKNYETILGELRDKQNELEEKYSIKGKPTLGQAIAFETQKISARENFMNQLKNTAQKKGITAQTGSAKINEKCTYQKIDLEIINAEKGSELGLRVASNGKEFVTVNLKATNKSNYDAFLSPDESFKLIADGNEINSTNYTIPTNIDPGKTVEGNILFIVLQDSKDFAFQIGKKVEEKKKFKFKI